MAMNDLAPGAAGANQIDGSTRPWQTGLDTLQAAQAAVDGFAGAPERLAAMRALVAAELTLIGTPAPDLDALALKLRLAFADDVRVMPWMRAAILEDATRLADGGRDDRA